MLSWLFYKFGNHCLNFLWVSSLVFSLSLAAAPRWNWKESPDSAAWKEFQQLSPARQAALWKQLEKNDFTFETIAWEWRLAWVQACANSEEKWCAAVLQHGLFDRALVVRAETAARLGERFAGTGHPPVLRLLSTAYAVQQNSNKQQPLYVQYRILHAIKQIGGKEGLALGERLAQKSDATSRYWTLMARGESARQSL